jgi:hypothetical protein
MQKRNFGYSILLFIYIAFMMYFLIDHKKLGAQKIARRVINEENDYMNFSTKMLWEKHLFIKHNNSKIEEHKPSKITKQKVNKDSKAVG